MSIHHVICFVLTCDTCTITAGETEDGYTVHFHTDREALDYAADNGWQITEDGHVSCPRCTGISACDTTGHRYGDWHICGCRATLPPHDTEGCGFYRYCARCDTVQECSLTELPTIAEPHRSS